MARMKYEELKKLCDEYKAQAEKNNHLPNTIEELKTTIEDKDHLLKINNYCIEEQVKKIKELERMNDALDRKFKNRIEQVDRLKDKLKAARDIIVCTVGKVESIGALASDLCAGLEIKYSL